jgi:Tfp pilus assembly protein PilF
MSDQYSRYEDGLHQLLDQIGPAHAEYATGLVYQQRLIENIAESRRYGDTETLKAERSKIIDQLNRLALSALGQPFIQFIPPPIQERSKRVSTRPSQHVSPRSKLWPWPAIGAGIVGLALIVLLMLNWSGRVLPGTTPTSGSGADWVTPLTATSNQSNPPRCTTQSILKTPDEYVSRGIENYMENYTKRDFDCALSNFEQAISLDPNNAVAYSYRGIVRYYKNQRDDALKDLNKAIELDTNNAMAYLYRGIILDARNDDDNAISDYNKAIRFELDTSEKWKAYHYLGVIYYERGQIDDALYNFDQVIKIQDTKSDAYYYRGKIYYDKKQYDAALVDLCECLKLNSDHLKKGDIVKWIAVIEENIHKNCVSASS